METKVKGQVFFVFVLPWIKRLKMQQNENNSEIFLFLSKKPEFNLSRFLVTNKKKAVAVSSFLLQIFYGH